MSGFVAVLSDGAPVPEGAIEGLAGAYRTLRGAASEQRASAPGLVEAVKWDNEASPRPGVERRADGSWASAVGALHASGGLLDSPLTDLDGQFALLRYDAGEDRLTVASDPFGMQPLHRSRRDGLVYISTSVLALARHLRAPLDELGVLTYLRAGYHFGTQTSWQGIERLDPATALTGRRDGPATADRYWRPGVDPAISRLSLADAADRCLQVALARYRAVYTGRPTWSDLSGGYDTRMLNLMMAAAGVAIQPQTRRTNVHLDPLIAERVARRAGWQWRLLELPSNWQPELRDLVPQAVAWGDGNLDALNLSRNLWAHRELAAGGRSLLNGIGGDHFRSHAWRQEFFREGRSSAFSWDNLLDMRLLHPMDVSMFRTDPTPDVRADMKRRMDEWRAPYREELNTVQLDVLHAYKQTGHAGAYCAADGGYLQAHLPHYLRDVFETAFSVDYRLRNHHRLMRTLIHRLNPAVAAIPTDSGGPAAPWHWTRAHQFAPYYLLLGRRALNKLTERALGRAIWPLRGRPLPGVDAGARAFVRSLGLTPETMYTAELYDVDGLRALLQRGDDGAPVSDELGRVVTVELAARMVAGQPALPPEAGS